LDDISDALNVLVNDTPIPLDAGKPLSFNRANSEFDIRNRFVLSYNYVVPFTKGFSGWKKYLLDGWSTGGIFSAQSGMPVTVIAAPIATCLVSFAPGGVCPNDAMGNSQTVFVSDLLLNGTNNPSNNNPNVNTAVNGNATQLHPVPLSSNF